MDALLDLPAFLAAAWLMAPVFWSLVVLAVVLAGIAAWQQERAL